MSMAEPANRDCLTTERFVEPAIQKLMPSEIARSRALIDIDELSSRLCIAKGTLYNWVYLRRIPFVKLGRALRFDPLEIERVLQASSTLEEVGRR
ncbi:MAG: helix-turn-helix domain-containing protein [Bryobacteraceae bacterium]